MRTSRLPGARRHSLSSTHFLLSQLFTIRLYQSIRMQIKYSYTKIFSNHEIFSTKKNTQILFIIKFQILTSRLVL